MYLILRGGSARPRTLRVSSERVKFLRPDERSLAILVQKTLLGAPPDLGTAFVEVRPGLDLRCGGLELLIEELGAAPRYWLQEGGSDLRAQLPPSDDAWFFLGDHLGFDTVTYDELELLGSRKVSVGPLSLHAEDVVTLIQSELDRAFIAA